MNTTIQLRGFCLTLVGAVLVAMLAACSTAPLAPTRHRKRPSRHLGDLAGSGDAKKTEEMFGADSLDLFHSGDDVADHEDAMRVKAMIQEKLAFQDLDEKTKAAVIGNEEWIFPIPLVLENGRWRFDAAAGREELLNRRIGRNELSALASLHAYVDAQREYKTQGRDRNAAGRTRAASGARKASTTGSTGR